MIPKLELIEVTKRYGKIRALDHVSLTFVPGVYGLLGPNGAGKSTLMKIITDSIRASSGEVLFCEREIRQWKRLYRAALGYMPQQQGIYEEFTARRFLTYMALLKDIPKPEIEKEIERVLELVHLSQVADQKLGTFSGGMKQRILIAQAVLGDPKILILDEPTAGLDPKERIRIRNMISRIAMNRIVIIATHVVSDIEFIAKKIVLMKKGEVLGCQPPAKWLEELQGKVYEIAVSEQEVESLTESYLVCNIRKDEKEQVWARVIVKTAEEVTSYNDYHLVWPTLEDLYLLKFQEEGEAL